MTQQGDISDVYKADLGVREKGERRPISMLCPLIPKAGGTRALLVVTTLHHPRYYCVGQLAGLKGCCGGIHNKKIFSSLYSLGTKRIVLQMVSLG